MGHSVTVIMQLGEAIWSKPLGSYSMLFSLVLISKAAINRKSTGKEEEVRITVRGEAVTK